MGRLALLFVLVPAVELAVLIEIGGWIGTPATFLLIVVTGIAGAILARAQGVRVLRDVQRELDAGRLPGAALVDGAIVLVSAALLLTPGVLTDAVGLLGLIPPARARLRRLLWRSFERAVRERRVELEVYDGRPPTAGRSYDAEYHSLD